MPDIIDLTDDAEESLPMAPPLLGRSNISNYGVTFNAMPQAYPRGPSIPNISYPPPYASSATQLIQQQQFRSMPYPYPYTNYTSNTPSMPAPVPYVSPTRISFSLVNTNEFTATSDRILTRDVMNLLKTVPGGKFSLTDMKWTFPLAIHHQLRVMLTQHKIAVIPLPNHILAAMQLQANNKESKNHDTTLLQPLLPERLYNALAPFQREGVLFVHNHNGRVILADEMGLGKTIQAIAASSLYTDSWPVLVIVPSSAKYQWKDEVAQWLSPELLQPHDIVVIDAGVDKLPEAKYYIVSYGLVTNMQELLLQRKFGMVIVDESHYIKNSKAKRTKSVMSILESSEQVILLTGTPALSRPYELYTQLIALERPIVKSVADPVTGIPTIIKTSSSWGTEKQFIARYCTSNDDSFGSSKGARNLQELHTLLYATIMIRRLKSDIMKQLPPKTRYLRNIEIEDASKKEEFGNMIEVINDMKTKKRKQTDTETPRRSMLLQLFTESGAEKVKSAVKMIDEILEDELSGKILLFGHHQVVLDYLAEYYSGKFDYIRIDGSTNAKDRHQKVQYFQQSDCRLAILSITAAGTSTTLTSASTVIFVELFWTPGVLLQAEDRVHRIGQLSSVKIYYLIAEKCIDVLLWPLLENKMKVLGEIFEGKENSFNAKSVDVDIAELAEELAVTDVVKAAVAEEESEDDSGSGRDTPSKRSSVATPTSEGLDSLVATTCSEADDGQLVLPGIAALSAVPVPSSCPVDTSTPQKIIIDIDEYETIRKPFSASRSSSSHSQPTYIFDISDDEI